MSRRGLLLLVVLFAAALGILFWLDRPAGPPGGQAAAKKEESLLSLVREKVRHIELVRGPTRLALERDGPGRWRMTSPAEGEADAQEVDRLLEAVASARISRVVEENATDEARFGLAPPEAELRIESEGGSSTPRLRLGRLSPVGFERYASAGDGRVVLVDGSLGTALLRDPDGFRQKRLIPVDAERVRRIALVRGRERIVVEREGSEWRMREPIRDLGDATSCDSLARSLTRLALDRIAEPAKLVEILSAFADPALDAEVAAGSEGTFRIQVAAGGEGGDRPARRLGSTVVGWLRGADLRDLMERKAAELRDKRLVLCSLPEILEARLEREGRTLTVRREKEGEPWRVEEGGTSGPADGGKVEDFLDRLRWLRAMPVEAGVPPASWELSILFAGASGPVGRLDIGPEFEERAAGGAEKKRVARSSWRPGFLFSFPSESLGAIPSGRADLASAPSAPGAGNSP